MSFHFSSESLYENIFLLQMLVCGSEDYCSEFSIRSDRYENRREWTDYHVRLKSKVSTLVIETSIKSRMLADFIDRQTYIKTKKSNELLQLACDNSELGYVLEGDINFTLRESFNKIVHATEANLVWDRQTGDNGDYQTWNGVIEMSGWHQGKKWAIGIYIFEWSKNVKTFIAKVEREVSFEEVFEGRC